jgi:hypothetical protein
MIESSGSSFSDDEYSYDDKFDGNSCSDGADEFDSEDSSSSSKESEDEYLEDLEVNKYKKKGKAKVLETDNEVVYYGSFEGVDTWDSLIKKFELEVLTIAEKGVRVLVTRTSYL